VSKYLLKNLDYLGGLLKGRAISLFLDYDGTLTPIVGRPEGARLSYQIKELLRALVRLYPTVIISGRALDDLIERVSIKGLVYAGNHGMEIFSEGFTMVFDTGSGAREELKRLNALLRGLPRSFRGVIIEDKGATLSVHYRLLDAREVKPFARKFMEITGPSVEKGLVRVTEGKKVFEVRPPVFWHKGKAVEWMLARRGFSATWPIYAGDDETDMDAFRVVKGAGSSVFVGSGERGADFYLKAQDEVKNFLNWLKDLGRKRAR
jgi:trehalose-phosphatase